jgi:hypothetical protein
MKMCRSKVTGYYDNRGRGQYVRNEGSNYGNAYGNQMSYGAQSTGMSFAGQQPNREDC